MTRSPDSPGRWPSWRNSSTSTRTRSRLGAPRSRGGATGVFGELALNGNAPAVDLKDLHANWPVDGGKVLPIAPHPDPALRFAADRSPSAASTTEPYLGSRCLDRRAEKRRFFRRLRRTESGRVSMGRRCPRPAQPCEGAAWALIYRVFSGHRRRPGRSGCESARRLTPRSAPT